MDNNSEFKLAIIGMSGVFPQSPNISTLWNNITNKKDCIKKISPEFLEETHQVLASREANYVPYKGIIDDIELFDYNFFGYSKSEADSIDPQQRLMLQVSWNAFEDAGYSPNAIEDRKIGVYIGASENSYIKLFERSGLEDWKDQFIINMGNLRDLIATRISYLFNFHGPSINVQTACSTSLAALYEASRALLSRDCNVALVGASAIRIPQNTGHIYYPGGVYSKDGKCRPFDKNSSGTVSGNGVAAIIVKRLDDAIIDNNRIYSIITSVLANNDGNRKAGFTAPSIEGQSDLIKESFELTEIDVNKIGYIETHGTGTPLGDPIEFQALSDAIESYSSSKNFCALGGIKSNIGHLDACSGIAGLIKSSLVLFHKIIPPHLYFEEESENINLLDSPFYINKDVKNFDINRFKYACVNSIGIGGTNVFSILELPPKRKEKHKTPEGFYFLPLSVHDKEVRQKNIASLQSFVSSYEGSLIDLSSSLALNKLGKKYKTGLWVEHKESINKFLASSINIEENDGKIAFVFPGGGSFYFNMLREVRKEFPQIESYVNECLSFIDNQKTYCNLKKGFFEEISAEEFNILNLDTFHNLITSFIVNHAVAKLLINLNIYPDILIGHSLGEYNCAVLASVFSIKDALSIIEKRSDIFDKANRSVVVNVYEEKETLKKCLPPLSYEFVASNSKSNNTIIISPCIKDDIIKILDNNKYAYKILPISVPAHSSYLDPYLEDFYNSLQSYSIQPPQIPIISNLTGNYVKNFDAHYWVEHLRKEVLFTEGVKFLLEQNTFSFVQVGMGSGLLSLIKENLNKNINTIPTLGDNASQELKTFLNAIASFWLAGNKNIAYNLPQIQSRGGPTPLPPYNFKKTKCWIDKKITNFSKPTSKISVYKEELEKFFIKHYQYEKEHVLNNLTPIEDLFYNDYDIEKYIKNIEGESFFNVALDIEKTKTAEFFLNFLKFARNLAKKIPKRVLPVNIFLKSVDEKDFLVNSLPIRSCITCINQEIDNVIFSVFGYSDIQIENIDLTLLKKYIDNEKFIYLSSNAIAMPGYVQLHLPNYENLLMNYNADLKLTLLIGGIGRVGIYLLSKLLAKTKDKIIIIGRKRLNLDKLDKSILPNISDVNFNTLIELIKQYPKRIEYIECDISNQKEILKLSTKLIHKGVKSISSIVYAASASSKSSIRQLLSEVQDTDIHEQLSPKAISLKHITSLTNKIPTANIILLSSNAARLGGPGMFSYALSNALIDTAARSNQSYSSIVSISLDAFRFRNESLSDFQKTDNYIDEENLFYLFLFSFLCQKNENIIVSNEPYFERVNKWVYNPKAFLEEMDIADKDENNDVNPSNISETIMKIWEDLLGENKIDLNSDFFKIGGHSLLAFKLLSKINNIYNIKISLYDIKKNSILIDLKKIIETKINNNSNFRQAPKEIKLVNFDQIL